MIKFEELFPISILLLFLFLLLFSIFSNTGVHSTCIQCAISFSSSSIFVLLFLLLFRTGGYSNFCFNFLLLLLVFLLFLLLRTLCLHIIHLDLLHIRFLFLIILCLPLQGHISSSFVLENLALRLILVKLSALLGCG